MMTYTLNDLHNHDPWLWNVADPSQADEAHVRTYLEGLYPGIQLSDEQMEDFVQNSINEEAPPPPSRGSPPPPPLPDTRPLIDAHWRTNHLERWAELNIKPEHCPVCFESDVTWDGCLGFGKYILTPTRCIHWFCEDCFEHIRGMDGERRRRCPMCKDPW